MTRSALIVLMLLAYALGGMIVGMLPVRSGVAAAQAPIPAPAPSNPAAILTALDVAEASHDHGVPMLALYALWQQECGGRPACRMGGHGEHGPFQIQARTARQHDCIGKWRAGPGNAHCAARILAHYLTARGSIRAAYSGYNWPTRAWRKPSGYAQQVYERYLILLVRGQQNIQIVRM